MTENHDDESIIIFHSCTTSDSLGSKLTDNCVEDHTGNTPRSVMTKGISTGKGRFTHKILIIFYRSCKSLTFVDAIGLSDSDISVDKFIDHPRIPMY